MRRITHRRLAAVAVVGALALAGCGNQEQADLDQQDTQGTPKGQHAEPEENPSGDDGGTSTSVGTRDIDTAEVLAEQTYELPGTEDAATFGVHSLVVEDEVMMLYLTFTPDFESVSNNDTVSVYDTSGSRKFQPTLIDRDNLKEYSLISDTGQDWSAGSLEVEATNGDTAVWWGVYAAPEDDIDTFDLRIFDDMSEFTDVPVSR